jgi:hypothetical protein
MGELRNRALSTAPLPIYVFDQEADLAARRVTAFAAWAWRTHLRTVSAVPTPNKWATSLIAVHSRLVLIADLGDHPHRPLTQLRRVPLRRTT